MLRLNASGSVDALSLLSSFYRVQHPPNVTGGTRCLQGLFKIAKGEKNVRLGLLGRAGPPDDRLWLRKIRSWEKSILFSPKHALSEW